MSKVVFFGSPHPAWISSHPKVCRIISTAAPEVVSFKADDNLKPGEVEWANYIRVRQTGYYCGCRVNRYLWRARGGTLHPRSLEYVFLQQGTSSADDPPFHSDATCIACILLPSRPGTHSWGLSIHPQQLSCFLFSPYNNALIFLYLLLSPRPPLNTKGVVAAFRKDVPEGHELSFDAAIASDVPLGGGLSSSAALEVSVATLLEEITGVKISGVEKALRQANFIVVFRTAAPPREFSNRRQRNNLPGRRVYCLRSAG